jgi:hypothetical protein
MMRFTWKMGALGLAVAAVAFTAGGLAAQTLAPRLSSRADLSRSGATSLGMQALAVAKPQFTAPKGLTGTILMFEYDPNLSRQIDVTGNGAFQDNGDRALLQGALFLSDRTGRKGARAGVFASEYVYLDATGETTGTDLSNTIDMTFIKDGQVRAGGFWNTTEGVGAPAVGVLGATGGAARRYVNGELVFLGRVSDTQEIYFLAR